MIFSPSLSHCTAAPAMKTLPSSAYVRAPPRSHATVVRSRFREATARRRCSGAGSSPCRRCSSRGPGGRRPARRAPPAGRRRGPRSGTSAPSRRVVPTTPDDGTMRGRTSRGTSRSREELVVPGARVDVVEERPARVRGVGHVHGAARELPDEPRSRPSRTRARRARPARARRARGRGATSASSRRSRRRGRGRSSRRTSASWPAARSASQIGAVLRSCQTIAFASGRPVARSQRSGRLALVRDADRRDVAAREARLRERLVHHARLRRPDLGRVVLDPAGLREDLPELLLRRRDDASRVVEDERARAGRALVEGEDERHVRPILPQGGASRQRGRSVRGSFVTLSMTEA